MSKVLSSRLVGSGFVASSISDDGVFLNYAINQLGILLAGSWRTRGAILPKHYKGNMPTLRGRRHGIGVRNTITHDSFDKDHLLPMLPTTCTFSLSFHASHNHGTRSVFCNLCTALQATARPMSLVSLTQSGNFDFVLTGGPPFMWEQ